MTAQFAWMYFLDVFTSAVAWAAFGLGCIVTAVCALWAAWWGARAARIPRRQICAQTAGGDRWSWESGQLGPTWLHVDTRTETGFCRIAIVNERTQRTELAWLNSTAANSLTAWLNEQLRGVPK